ncbi:GspE/PulE family protein [Caballeronia ptereochthonis]|uniref:Type II/IV secretion system protein n=1 Tax=Caballeronia ptereochthonis TaxID=1777144 RepID=A0A158E4X2_9BURK|nr:ATPase, T2SS/T4P/T4SS family [Caballeronia ptereochthonis]SAL01486.1 type II/IV secretion system protein [Caballeronia ptereochthonis]
MISPSRDAFDTFARPPRTADPARDSAPDNEAPAVSLLAETLREAAERGASDIHVEPSEHDWRIRVRVDGVLHGLRRPPPHLRDAFVTRIKVLARMDIAERRVPQDGRLRLNLPGGRFGDYRVNSLPTLFGEKLVLRRLDALPSDLSLAALGLADAQGRVVESAIRAPHGLVLVTGPTGSGKTLSLYCFLQMLNAEARNVCSVEDPVEIQLAGINQVSVREKAGLTFAVALRAFMRQDPDVIMVGEIRDAETADVAVKAAQTGHLVLSTLHTNDAPAAIARLIDIGVAPYNLASALRLVTAQRLVRKLCEQCRAPSALPLDDGFHPFEPRGCAACHGIGYRGRVGVHQLMPVSDELRELIVSRAATHAISRAAQSQGMPALRDAAFARVREGVTSIAEAAEATEVE